MKPLHIAMRVDASLKIGSGHLMRCLTLASRLREAGMRVTFITRAHPGNPLSMIGTSGFAYRFLPSVSTVPPEVSEHASWLGCAWQHDASETLAVLQEAADVDWLVVDHYGIDARWETRMRAHVHRIMVIDDLAERAHDCDLLLDQNLYPEYGARYDALVPPRCGMLLGPRHALLRPEFAAYRVVAMSRQAREPYRLVVFFGGVDATNETGKFLSAWAKRDGPGFKVDVVVGVSNPRSMQLAKQARVLKGVRLHGRVANMAELMARADYAFGASGVTNWERFCLGLNSSITCVATNQRELARHLGDIGLIEYLGEWTHTGVSTYTRALGNLDIRSSELALRRKKIMQLVDGLGVDRVIRRIAAGPERIDEDDEDDIATVD